MPRSRAEGKQWITQRVISDEPTSILDVGAGAGTYWDLLHNYLPYASWTAVEIFAPYVTRFRLARKYDTVITGNFLDLDLTQHDVVILGDVLEHLDKSAGIVMWDKARSLAAKSVYLCLPLDHYEQGPVDGNVHETHRHHWSHQEVLDELAGITEHFQGARKGCYRAEIRW